MPRKIPHAMFLAVIIFVISCGKVPEPRKTYSHTAPVTPVAFLVAEWNGMPHVVASAFLINREKGLFLTAKHFTDELFALGTEKCRLFFNGFVYEAVVVKVPPLRDAAAVMIEGKFDPSLFPEPYKMAREKPVAKEKIFIEGAHPHPLYIRKINADEGFPDTTIPILRDYYEIVMHDSTREMEIVLDRLSSRVVSAKTKIALSDKNADDWSKLRDKVNYYIKAKTDRNHHFSFGGLSGGPVTNEGGELVGIVTAEEIVRLEFDNEKKPVNPWFQSAKRVADTIYVTPIEDIKDLFVFLAQL